MFKRIVLAFALAFPATLGLAQSVQQSGSVTPNTAAIWNSTGVIKGGVTATDSPLTTFGVTRDGVDALCVSSARQTAAGRNQLCLQAATNGPGKISLQNYGTATAQDLQFVINGTAVTIPTGGGSFLLNTGGQTTGHMPCFTSTANVMQDCGVGVGAGTQWGVPYYSAAGVLSSSGASAAGQVFLGQGGSAPLWTSLSGDVQSVAANGALTLSKVNGIPFSSSYTAHGVLLAQGSSAFTSLTTASVGQCLLSQGTSADPIWSSCAAGTGSAGGSNTQVQFNNSTSLGGSANLTWVSPALTIGVAGTTTGQLALASSTATGTVTLQSPGVSGTYNFNLPTGAGTTGQPLISGGGGSSPNTFGTLGVFGGGTACNAASGTCLDNITGFSSTGFMFRSGAGTYTFTNPVPVGNGGTGLISGTSGGVLAFTGSTTIVSSGALAQYSLVAGGGAGAAPEVVTKGTAGQILIEQTGANPSWNSLSGDATINSAGALTVANSAISNAKLANASGYTLKGNFTGSSAAPQDVTIGSLTQKASPAASDLILLQDQAAAGALKYATVSSISSAGSVASLNSQTGALTLNAGLTNSGTTFTLNSAYSGFALQNCTLTASVGSNLLTVALKDYAGNDPSAASPCYLNYLSPTTTSGGIDTVPQTTALSIDTNATGATLGSSNNTAFRFWVVVFNNSGTNVLALINCTNSSGEVLPLNEYLGASSTAMSGSATSSGVFYTPNGTTVTNKGFRILGYIEYNSTGLATAGTYNAAPTFVRNFGTGMHRPGERVQLRTAYGVSGGTTSSATLAVLSSSPSRSITPQSAANPIRVQYTSSLNGNTAGGAYVLQLSRGSTAVGTQCPVNVVTNAPNYPCTLQAYDRPNTTSSTTYQLQGSASAGMVATPAAAGGGYQFEVEEIMG